MRITADTNFFVSATLWYGSVAQKLLRKLIEANVGIFTTEEILNEFCEVLQRDFNYNEIQIKEIVGYLLSFVTIVEPKQKVDVVKEDPDDNKIIECAVDSKSEYIITYDKHLLKLKEYNGILIITPEQMIDILR